MPTKKTALKRNNALDGLDLDFAPPSVKKVPAKKAEQEPKEKTAPIANPKVVQSPPEKVVEVPPPQESTGTETAEPGIRDMSFLDRQKTVHFEPDIYDAICDLEYELRKSRNRIPRSSRPPMPNRSAIVMAGLKVALEEPDRIRAMLGFPADRSL